MHSFEEAENSDPCFKITKHKRGFKKREKAKEIPESVSVLITSRKMKRTLH